MKKIRKAFTRGCIRPCIYMVFRRVIYAVLLVLLVEYFAGDKLNQVKSVGFSLLCILSLTLAWLNYLRLDGMHLPKNPHLKTPRRKKRVFSYGDMEDHLDEIPRDAGDLEDEEADACACVGDLCTALILLVISLWA